MQLKIIHDLCNWKISGHSEDEHFREVNILSSATDSWNHSCCYATFRWSGESYLPSRPPQHAISVEFAF